MPFPCRAQHDFECAPHCSAHNQRKIYFLICNSGKSADFPTPAQRAQIRARVDAYEALARAENPDFNKLYEMDCRLHETWFAAMDKMYLWSTLQNAHADYSRFRMLDTMTTGGLDEVIADHRNLLNAIERCDLAAFEPLVERHLYGGIRRLGSKLTKEYADFFEPENVK